MKLTIACPTVTGREDHVERLVEAYRRTIPEGVKVDLVMPKDLPTCGIGWQAGVARSLRDGFEPDYVHLTCDDIEPLPGWFEVAVATVQAGYQPAPMLDTFGEIAYGHPPTPDMSDWKPTHTSVLPFMAAWWWTDFVDPMIPLHYYTDDYASEQCRRGGHPPICRTGYAFRHHHSNVKRGAGMTQNERLHHDMRLYELWRTNGTWPS